jgi:hypothetical protein
MLSILPAARGELGADTGLIAGNHIFLAKVDRRIQDRV